MDTAVASSTNSAGIAVTVTSAASAGNNANGGVTMLSPASSSTQLNAAAAADGDSAASMEPLRQALQDAVRYGENRVELAAGSGSTGYVSSPKLCGKLFGGA